MKKTSFWYILFVLVIIQTSCRSTKDITMYQSERKGVAELNAIEKAAEHKIQPFDNLYLSVLTLDPEVNQLFNPSVSGNGFMSGTQQMYGSPESMYINGYQVAANGTVNLPILGEIFLAGLNLEQARDSLKARAEVYLKEPTVQVKLLNYKINIAGEVKLPGIYYNYEGSLNIVEALSLAGGITNYANLRNVKVVRQFENQNKTIDVDLTNKSMYDSEVYFLYPNDMVYVPPGKLKRKQENSSTYSLILSTISTILVAVALAIPK